MKMTMQKDKDLNGPTNTSSTESADKEDTYRKNCGDVSKSRSATKASASEDLVAKMVPKPVSIESRELLKFGSMLSDSVTGIVEILWAK